MTGKAGQLPSRRGLPCFLREHATAGLRLPRTPRRPAPSRTSSVNCFRGRRLPPRGLAAALSKHTCWVLRNCLLNGPRDRRTTASGLSFPRSEYVAVGTHRRVRLLLHVLWGRAQPLGTDRAPERHPEMVGALAVRELDVTPDVT